MTPGVRIQSGWTGAGRVRRPARIPEAETSGAGEQELLSRMNQVKFLSVLHVVGNLSRRSFTDESRRGTTNGKFRLWATPIHFIQAVI